MLLRSTSYMFLVIGAMLFLDITAIYGQVITEEKASETVRGVNPFEMRNRMNRDSLFALEGGSTLYTSENPFEVQKKSTVQKNDRLEREFLFTPKMEVVGTPIKNFNSILFTSLMILFAVFWAIFQNTFKEIYRSFLNENILKLAHREQVGFIKGPFLMWYLYSFLSLSSFFLAVGRQFGIFPSNAGLSYYLSILALLLVIFFVKHLLLSALGAIFNIGKAFGVYNFTIVTYMTILGLSLMPVNLLVAFGPEEWQIPCIYLGFALFILVYGIRSMRSLSLTSKTWSRSIFHFFMYLCAVEIAPLFVLVKLVLMG